MKRTALMIAASMLLFGCIDAQRAQISSLGQPAEVICFAAVGKVFYRGRSTG